MATAISRSVVDHAKEPPASDVSLTAKIELLKGSITSCGHVVGTYMTITDDILKQVYNIEPAQKIHRAKEYALSALEEALILSKIAWFYEDPNPYLTPPDEYNRASSPEYSVTRELMYSPPVEPEMTLDQTTGMMKPVVTLTDQLVSLGLSEEVVTDYLKSIPDNSFLYIDPTATACDIFDQREDIIDHSSPIISQLLTLGFCLDVANRYAPILDYINALASQSILYWAYTIVGYLSLPINPVIPGLFPPEKPTDSIPKLNVIDNVDTLPKSFLLKAAGLLQVVDALSVESIGQLFYHGTTWSDAESLSDPDVAIDPNYSRYPLQDFGRAFYVYSERDLAIKWAFEKAGTKAPSTSISLCPAVLVFCVPRGDFYSLKHFSFEKPDDSWTEFTLRKLSTGIVLRSDPNCEWIEGPCVNWDLLRGISPSKREKTHITSIFDKRQVALSQRKVCDLFKAHLCGVIYFRSCIGKK